MMNDLEAQIAEQFEQVVGPLASAIHSLVRYTASNGHTWEFGDAQLHAVHDSGGQSSGRGAAVQDLGVASSMALEVETLPLTCAGHDLGMVEIWYGRTNHPQRQALRCLVLNCVDLIDKQVSESALLLELSTSWECLEAVYDISKSLRSLSDCRKLVMKILERIHSLHAGAHAVLWWQREGHFAPIARLRVPPLETRPLPIGLLERALTQRNGLVCNGRPPLGGGNVEPELWRATSVAVAPIATPEGTLGGLVVWIEDEGEQFDSRTLHLVEALAHQAALVLENDRLYQASLDAQRLQREVEISGHIQTALLQSPPPAESPHYQITALSIPSRHVDGDFYDFYAHDPHTLDVLIGDVMGKGIPAALTAAATKSQFLRSQAMLAHGRTPNSRPSPAELVSAVHQHVVPQLIDLDEFITLCYLRFDFARRELNFIHCGHTRIVQFRPANSEVFCWQGDNVPLGFLNLTDYSEERVEFSPGDLFIVYSDGITESVDPAGVLFGEERLLELVRQHGHRGPTMLMEQVRAAVLAYADGQPLSDDLTCVVVEARP